MSVRSCRFLLFALALSALFATSASATTYSASQTLPVPPASNFAGSGGGDGWDVSLSSDKIYQAYHHQNLTIACHMQSDASNCWSPKAVTDELNRTFRTSARPSTHLDQTSHKLFVYVTRSDAATGVVCFDTVAADAGTNPFCGFTVMAPAGQSGTGGWGSAASNAVQYGTKWYAMNYVNGQVSGGSLGTGAQNKLMCFDFATAAACANQPYAVNLGASTLTTIYGGSTDPAIGLAGSDAIIPVAGKLGCFDVQTATNCAGAWPVTASNDGQAGPYPMLDAAGTATGVCLPQSGTPCWTLAGASATTPNGMATAMYTGNYFLNGAAVTIGPRVYMPNAYGNNILCWDYSTSAKCTTFPKAVSGLFLLYSVNADPQRPSCLWVNADSGTQIQSFDAYTGGACGQGATRVLASQFIVPQQACVPTAYDALQIVSPTPDKYTSGTIAFANGAGNPITGINALPIGSDGKVSLTGLDLNTNTGLPQFIVNLVGTTGSVGNVEVKLTWTGSYDPACVKVDTVVTKAATTITPALSGGGQTGPQLLVSGTQAVTAAATLAGANAAAALGKVTYTWYSDGACTNVASGGVEQALTAAGTLPSSDPATFATTGTYYAVAHYGGDAGNLVADSACGALKVVVDATAPVTADNVSSAYTTAPVPVTLDASDVGAAGGLVTKYQVIAADGTAGSLTSYDSAQKPTLADGEKLRYFTTDGVGNAEVAHDSLAAKVDQTILATSDDVPATYSNARIPVTLTTKAGPGGLGKTYYTTGVSPAVPTLSSDVYDPEHKPTLGDGESISYFSVDAIGNLEAVKTSAAAKVDAIAPATTDDVPGGEQSGPVPVTLTAGDTGGSGLGLTYYTTGADPAVPTTASAVYDATHKPVLGDGDRIRYFSVDGVGNAEAVKLSAPVNVTQPPGDLESTEVWVVGHTASVTVTCPADAPADCQGTVEMRNTTTGVRGARRDVAPALLLGTGVYNVKPGFADDSALGLTHVGRRVLGERGKRRVFAKVIAHGVDASGNPVDTMLGAVTVGIDPRPAPRAVTAIATPKLSGDNLTVVTRGHVVPTKGMTAAKACADSRARVTLYENKTTQLAQIKVPMTANCTYRAVLNLAAGAGKHLRVRTKFLGSMVMRPRSKWAPRHIDIAAL